MPFSLAQAAVSTWQQGVNIVPKYTTDFGSDAFKQSLQQLVATGASHVSLVVPYYQSNIYSTDIQRGGNTPTDESLRDGISYAKSLGLSVTLKIHIESWDGNWRANINPSDRDAWFTNYKNVVVHTAQIAQDTGVSVLSIGTELVSMTSTRINPDNTARWQSIISATRGVFNGSLTYGANSNDNSDDTFSNEKKFIGFWPQLDYIGLSTYYNLGYDNSVNGIKHSWDRWNNEDLRGFQSQYNKPLILAEVGYRSVENSQVDPWNYDRGGAISEDTQANAYEAALSYWNDYDYVKGAYFWDWESDPNAGGPNSTSYTPQHKKAEQVLTNWYTNAPSPNPTNPTQAGTAYDISATVAGEARVGQAAPLTVNVKNSNDSNQQVLVDVEVFDQHDTRIGQFYYDNQSLTAGETKSYNISVVPQSTGTHVVRVGVFANGWSQLYVWKHSALQFNVSDSLSNNGGSTGGNNGGTTGTSTNDTSTSTTPTEQPLSSGNILVWWPSDGSTVNGLQPFKAMVEGFSTDKYDMYWQVDGDALNMMYDNEQDYPHKEALVDLSGWNWKENKSYTITFIVRNKATGALELQKSVQISVQ